MAGQTHSTFEPADIGPGGCGRFQEAQSAFRCLKNPVMFVTEVGAALTTRMVFRTPGETLRLYPADRPLALVYGALRQFRRSHGRRPGQGPGQCAAQDADPDHGAIACADATARRRKSRRTNCEKATSWWSLPARSSRPTVRSIDGVASVDESAITGESAPVIREAGGDRSPSPAAPGSVGPDHSPRHGQPGRKLPGPHDPPGRRGPAPEDTQRDRPDDSPVGPDHHLLVVVITLKSFGLYSAVDPFRSPSWWRCWFA